MATELLRNTDLNLLVAFSVLMRERSVSAAAGRLHIGQSGMSGALGRLRELFGDPLLVRVGRRLEPTPRALALAEEVEQALAIVERAVGAALPFSPEASTRVFSIGMTDDHELLFGAPLAAALVREAPGARLVIRATHAHSMRAALDDGEVDAATSVAKDLPSWHLGTPLFEQGHACLWSPRQVARLTGRARQARSGALTLAQYLALGHALVTFRGDLTGFIDDVLAARGLRRNVVVGVSRFAALPELLLGAPLVATVPAPIAARFVRERGLASSPPPLDLLPRQVMLVFRQRDAAQRELTWFRDLVTRTIVATLGAAGPR